MRNSKLLATKVDDCTNAARPNQQLDQARVLRVRRWKFLTGAERLPSTTNQTPYLHTKWAVAFAEHNHLIGVDKLLYLRFEFLLPAVIFDGRHFRDISVCLRRASLGRRLATAGG